MFKRIIYLLGFLFLSLRGGYSQDDFNKGKALFEANKWEASSKYFNSHLAKFPSDPKTREYLGDVAALTKDWDTAIEYYKPLVEEFPNNADYNFKYGGALGMKAFGVSKIRALAYIGKIRKHFERAAALDPKHLQVRWALVEFYVQVPGFIGGSERKAIKYANELEQISPLDGFLANGYIAEYNKRPEDAAIYFKRAMALGEDALNAVLDPNNPNYQRNQLYYQIGKVAAQYNINPELGLKCLQNYITNSSLINLNYEH